MAESALLVRCVGCGALVPVGDGPIHRYMTSAPGCWAIYGELLARQYSDPAYREVASVGVDSYAVQHPGTPSSPAIHSVAMHLVRLYLMLEQGYQPAPAAATGLKVMADKAQYHWLDPPATLGAVTVLDVWAAQTVVDHTAALWSWARSAWSAWAPHHATVRQWVAVALR